MTVDYAAKARSADAMIRKFGATASHVSTSSVYDPSTGGTVDTQVTQTLRAVVFDYPAQMIDGTLIRVGDKQAYVSAVGVAAPKAGDAVTWGTVAHAVISCKPLAPALVNVLFELQLRA